MKALETDFAQIVRKYKSTIYAVCFMFSKDSALFAIPYCAWVFNHIGLSVWFCVVTCLFLLIAILYNFYSHYGLQTKDLLQGDLLMASQKVMRMKRLYLKWLRFGIPFICFWLSWFFTEVLYKLKGEGSDFLIAFLVGSVIGANNGVFLGFKQYRKTIRNADDLLQQIQELTVE